MISSNGTYIPRYTLKRVIDGEGKRLPAFDLLADAALHHTPVAEIPGLSYHTTSSLPGKVKTDLQLVYAGAPSMTASLLLAGAIGFCLGSCLAPCAPRLWKQSKEGGGCLLPWRLQLPWVRYSEASL